MPPRKPIAESANIPPDATPMSVGRRPPIMPPGLVDMITTPAVAMRIAMIIGQVSMSPRNTRPNTAT